MASLTNVPKDNRVTQEEQEKITSDGYKGLGLSDEQIKHIRELKLNHVPKSRHKLPTRQKTTKTKFAPRGPPRGNLPRGKTPRGQPRGQPRGPPPSQSLFNLVSNMDDSTFQSKILQLHETDCPTSWRPITRESLFKLPQWKQKKIMEGLQRKPQIIYKFPHSSTKTIPLHEINWDQGIKGIEKSDDGTVGVYFIELPNQCGVVLKFPSNCFPEMYGNQIAQLVNTPSPTSILMSRASPVGLSIVHAILTYQIKTFENNTKDWYTNVNLNIVPAIKNDFFVLMQYVPGAVLETLNDDVKMLLQETSSKSNKILNNLGAIIALDMVINNLDRIRTIRTWPESNPGNIYINKDNQEAVAIDNAAAWGSYDGKQGATVESYEQRIHDVQQLLIDLIASPNQPHSAFQNVQTLIKTGLSSTVIATKMWLDESRKSQINETHVDKVTGEYYLVQVNMESKNTEAEVAGWPGTGIDIGDTGILNIQNGFVECVQRFCQLPLCSFSIEKDKIEQIYSTELTMDKNQWITVITEMYEELDVNGNMFAGLKKELGLKEDTSVRNIVKMMTGTNTSSMNCSNVCSPKRCRRVVDVWKEVLKID